MTLQSIIITGAGSGIGRCVAQVFADTGLHVLAIGRRKDALYETASHNSEFIRVCQADVSNAEDRQRILEAARDLQKPLCMLHAAGVYQIGRLATLDMKDLEHSIEINALAKLSLTQLLLGELEGGRLLFVGSDAGATVRVGAGAYSISQSASMMIIRALMEELRGTLEVSAVMPGLAKTDMVSGFLKASEADFPGVVFYRELVEQGHIAPPETIAQFVKWVLLETDSQQFSSSTWDIRDETHHKHWLEGQLYPDSTTK